MNTKKRILVTGGSGFIGTNVVSFYHLRGHEVLSCDTNNPQCVSHNKIFRKIDIRDKYSLVKIFNEFKPTHVIHLAARTDLHEKKDIDGYDTNTKGVENIVEAVSNQPSIIKVIFTSSKLVCRVNYTPESDDDYCPSTLYGESKVISEKVIKSSNSMKCDWCIVRPTSIWGPWSFLPNNPYGKFFRMVAKGRYFHPGKKDPPRSYGYVGNSVFQIDKLLQANREQIHKKVFYLTDYETFTIKKWADTISLKLKYKKIRSIPEPLVICMALGGDIMKKCGYREPPFSSFRLNNMRTDTSKVDIEPIRSITGKLPYSMEQGVALTLEWIKRQQ